MKLIRAIVPILLIAITVKAQDDIEATTLLKLNAQMPAFTVNALKGGSFNSEELKGKVVLINFWATWCGPCKTEMPLIQKNIFDDIKNPEFKLLAISRGEEKEVVTKFIEKTKYSFPVYLDTNKKVYELFATRYIPRNFVIGKDGKVKWISTGFKQEEFDQMIELIKKELDVKS